MRWRARVEEESYGEIQPEDCKSLVLLRPDENVAVRGTEYLLYNAEIPSPGPSFHSFSISGRA